MVVSMVVVGGSVAFHTNTKMWVFGGKARAPLLLSRLFVADRLLCSFGNMAYFLGTTLTNSLGLIEVAGKVHISDITS
jgi:hypothetical protein